VVREPWRRTQGTSGLAQGLQRIETALL